MQRIRLKEALHAGVIMLLMLVVVTLLALLGNAASINKDSIIMLYLLGVLFSSVFTRRYVFGVVSAIAYALSFSYFFTRPTFSLRMISSSDIVLVFFFLATAISGSAIMSRLTRQMLKASHNEATARMMYEITNKFVHITGKRSIIVSGVTYIQTHSACVAAVRIDGDSEPYEVDRAPGAQTPPYEYSIPGPSGPVGVLQIWCADIQTKSKDELLYTAVAAQIGAALEREDLYTEREKIRFAMEREKSRSTFLRAVAHDIRTPLTSLTGASTLLAEQFDVLTAEEKRKLASDISEETVWLSNLVENILNMTRIDEAKLDIHKDFEVVDDVAAEAVKHMERLWGGRVLRITYPEEVVALRVDGKLIAQVLINLFDNAIKHTKPGDEILLEISVDDENAVFSVANAGEDIPGQMKQSIFEDFFSSDSVFTDKRRGVGLGLPICRAIVEAHGGKIWAEDNLPHGAKFIFTLPKGE